MIAFTENNNSMVVFFHGLDSSNETTKFTCINRTNKICETVDYRNNFHQAFNIYEKRITDNLEKYEHVVLAGHSLGGWFANHFAHQFHLPALLIAPCIDLTDRIPKVKGMDFPFLTNNNAEMRVIIETDDEVLPVAVAKKTLVDLPDSWDVSYFSGGHHRICREEEINNELGCLCHDGFTWIDDATWHGED